MLVEYIFLAVMGRLAGGRDLTLKVQNTPRNKFAFQSSSQNSLNPIESAQRMLNLLRNLRKKMCKISQIYRAGFFTNVDMGKLPGCQFWQTNERGRSAERTFENAQWRSLQN